MHQSTTGIQKWIPNVNKNDSVDEAIDLTDAPIVVPILDDTLTAPSSNGDGAKSLKKKLQELSEIQDGDCVVTEDFPCH